jgi:nitroreductase
VAIRTAAVSLVSSTLWPAVGSRTITAAGTSSAIRSAIEARVALGLPVPATGVGWGRQWELHTRPVPDELIRECVALAMQSPSGSNDMTMQFVVVREQARKHALRGMSFGQLQVEDCAAAIVVCGRLDTHEDAPRIYENAPAPMRDR